MTPAHWVREALLPPDPGEQDLRSPGGRRAVGGDQGRRGAGKQARHEARARARQPGAVLHPGHRSVHRRTDQRGDGGIPAASAAPGSSSSPPQPATANPAGRPPRTPWWSSPPSAATGSYRQRTRSCSSMPPTPPPPTTWCRRRGTTQRFGRAERTHVAGGAAPGRTPGDRSRPHARELIRHAPAKPRVPARGVHSSSDDRRRCALATGRRWCRRGRSRSRPDRRGVMHI
jgi:hypothetical protein